MRLFRLIALALAALLFVLLVRRLSNGGTPLEPASSAPAVAERTEASARDAAELDRGAPAISERGDARVSEGAHSSRPTVRLVDVESGAAVAGVRYRVLDPSVTEPLVAAGVSNAEGLLDLAGVPRRGVVIETERLPPHALGAQMVDLADEDEGVHLVRLGHGGSIAGVVHDDRGEPIAGVDWFATTGSPGLGGFPPFDRAAGPASTTDEAGRFEVAALAERPRRGVAVAGPRHLPSRVEVANGDALRECAAFRGRAGSGTGSESGRGPLVARIRHPDRRRDRRADFGRSLDGGRGGGGRRTTAGSPDCGRPAAVAARRRDSSRGASRSRSA